MNLEGRLLGNRYEIIEKIGNGGMATVYKAKCHVLNRYVAVKILRDEFTTDEEFIKRFEIEAQSAASITHPNIVSVYDVGNEGNLYYIVMELIQGKTLKEIIIEERGALPWKWSLNIAIQIASALEIAHKNNIVHRDIKPHNIIITEDGIAKVTDFGIAKAVSNSTITAFGTTIGSVHYFSPEHARGGFTDSKSDLYSLGVVMYEMLTGKVPFDADTPVSVALKHMQEEPVSPIEVNSRIPSAVNNIILKALKKDSSQRYSSATEMLQDLRRALKEPGGDFVASNYNDFGATQRIDIFENEKVKRDTRGKKTNKFEEFIKKHKILVWGVALILLFAISLGGTMLYFNLSKPKDIQIPNLVGKTSEEAEKILAENGIKIEYADEEYSKEVEAGKIISQEPPYRENYNVKEGSTIVVVISKGAELTTVPKVIGMTKDEAIQELKNYNLKAEVIEETSEEIKEGYITRQETAPETVIDAGETIKIYVSIGTGRIQVVVPSVQGKQLEDARKILTDLKLKVEVEYGEDTTKPNGQVLSQNVVSGTVLDEESTIVLTVNQIAEIKSGTVNIKLKEIAEKLGYVVEEQKDEEGNTTEKVSKIEVEVKVTSEGTTNPVYNKKVSASSENIAVTVQGKGTIKIELYIDGVYRVQQLDLNTEKPAVIFDKSIF
jgi:serine/threonine-protein kinase